MTDFEQRYVTARKAVIARDLARLNPMQRQGAMTTEGPLFYGKKRSRSTAEPPIFPYPFCNQIEVDICLPFCYAGGVRGRQLYTKRGAL